VAPAELVTYFPSPPAPALPHDEQSCPGPAGGWRLGLTLGQAGAAVTFHLVDQVSKGQAVIEGLREAVAAHGLEDFPGPVLRAPKVAREEGTYRFGKLWIEAVELSPATAEGLARLLGALPHQLPESPDPEDGTPLAARLTAAVNQVTGGGFSDSEFLPHCPRSCCRQHDSTIRFGPLTVSTARTLTDVLQQRLQFAGEGQHANGAVLATP
jgi:hypothetical protein